MLCCPLLSLNLNQTDSMEHHLDPTWNSYEEFTRLTTILGTTQPVTSAYVLDKHGKSFDLFLSKKMSNHDSENNLFFFK